MKSRFLVAVALLSVTACGASAQPPSDASRPGGESSSSTGSGGESQAGSGGPSGDDAPASPTAADLMAFVTQSSGFTAVIGPREEGGPGLGKTNVTIEGKAVWPPSGDACERFVSCCDERAAKDSTFDLVCQFAAIRHRDDCGGGLEAIKKVGSELALEPVAACE